MPKNSETKKLHSAQEKYYAYHGCPPVGGIVVHELAYREQDDCDARKQAEEYAYRRRHAERNRRKRRQRVERIRRKPRERPLGFSRAPLHVVKLDPLGLEADPFVHALYEAVILGHFEHGIDNPAVYEPEVARALDEFQAGKRIENPVKRTRAERADVGFAPARPAAGRDAVVSAHAHFHEHLRKQGGGILQVGVHYRGNVPAGGAQPRVHGGLLAEIARERNVLHPRILCGEFAQVFKRSVLRAVLHEDYLEILRAGGVHCAHKLRVENRQSLALVAARDYRAEHSRIGRDARGI